MILHDSLFHRLVPEMGNKKGNARLPSAVIGDDGTIS